MNDRLRAVMLRATGAGELSGPQVVVGAAKHPVCGDEMELQLRCQDGCITELAWRARGCPATMAMVALAGEVLPGLPLARAAASLQAALSAYGGLAAHERHAEAMLLRSLREAFAAAGGC